MSEGAVDGTSATLRAIALMVGSMAAFTLTDTFIKLASATLPTGEILTLLGLGAGSSFAVWSTLRGQPVINRLFLHPVVLLRNLGEVGGTIGFVTALSLVPLALATAIQQATPVAITVGAALVLRERVGPWRWSAVAAGFAGVLVIIRPGLEGFDVNALWALLAVAGLGLRDLTTRFLPPGTGTPLLAAWAFGSLVPTGLVMLALSGGASVPTPAEILLLAGAVVTAMTGYSLITASLRAGDVSAVAPYRYTRVLFALVVAVVFLGERPDAMTLSGTAAIVGAGLVILWRETRQRRRP